MLDYMNSLRLSPLLKQHAIDNVFCLMLRRALNKEHLHFKIETAKARLLIRAVKKLRSYGAQI